MRTLLFVAVLFIACLNTDTLFAQCSGGMGLFRAQPVRSVLRLTVRPFSRVRQNSAIQKNTATQSFRPVRPVRPFRLLNAVRPLKVGC